MLINTTPQRFGAKIWISKVDRDNRFMFSILPHWARAYYLGIWVKVKIKPRPPTTYLNVLIL